MFYLYHSGRRLHFGNIKKKFKKNVTEAEIIAGPNRERLPF